MMSVSKSLPVSTGKTKRSGSPPLEEALAGSLCDRPACVDDGVGAAGNALALLLLLLCGAEAPELLAGSAAPTVTAEPLLATVVVVVVAALVAV
jgi:hypothetical protein